MIIAREYFSISELSDYSGISKRTLWTLLKNPINPIPHFRVGSAGRIVRVRRSEFDDWMEGQRPDSNLNIDKIVDEIFSNEADQTEYE
jgi:excisionase family DNA binding protein